MQDNEQRSSVAVENVETLNVRPPAPACIATPDHEVRQARWFQIYVRLARPTHDWLVAGGVGWALIGGPVAGAPLDDGYLVQVLLYSGLTFGVRTYEKTKGVA